MLKIKRALISVSDKTGILDFAKVLQSFGVEILSTGGTAKIFRDNNIPVLEVSDYTGFPEMLDGRVKTLHPKIHGGLLAVRDNSAHMETVKKHNIGLIDMVVVNLYPFEKVIQKEGIPIEEAIENIDIGGPSMLRSAAKNHRSVAVISSPLRYAQVSEELKRSKGFLSEKTLQELGVEVFKVTSCYDSAINAYLGEHILNNHQTSNNQFPDKLSLSFSKLQDLRYGENPHQRGAFYRDQNACVGICGMKQLWGKELSFNNILDLNAAINIVQEFSNPGVVFIKHNNPCGVAENKNILKAYRDAWSCDKLSAFGGILAINRKIDLNLAKLIARSGFLECIVCPGFAQEAVELLTAKKNLRLLEFSGLLDKIAQVDFKRVSGGLLVQDGDGKLFNPEELKTVTSLKPSKSQMQSLLFAWKVAKHVKSNAIVLVKGAKTVGIGAGQMSRVDSVFISTKKSGKLAIGSVMASDAFFPKEDAIQLAAKFKIRAIIQPGGSIADEAIIKMADKHKIAMVFTGTRHFKH
ncbi:MAG: bifunctional phosphoribosylaminoimidazolecarboxamide formyltransferase/IMP cyclohydrolase [Candidatus Omnitrophica bacterium]|jgi:phosphoribosylaminoimidazolecarboxamide formyltransferase/IMP cyclohydrolase|nr:bifunctional phosphoribosylaminoimidazolecarboxamide formyltransferase/IMP cyclohydrolase [Candidatus Omnitrophota bacterium]